MDTKSISLLQSVWTISGQRVEVQRIWMWGKKSKRVQGRYGGKKKRQWKKCSNVVRKRDWKPLLLREGSQGKNYSPTAIMEFHFAWLFFSTFSKWWEERLVLAMISILPHEMFKVLINTYRTVLRKMYKKIALKYVMKITFCL